MIEVIMETMRDRIRKISGTTARKTSCVRQFRKLMNSGENLSQRGILSDTRIWSHCQTTPGANVRT